MREYVIEYLGTVFFLYVVAITANPLVIGAALAMALYVAHSISEGGFNPGVALVRGLTGKLPMSTLAPYILVQLAAVVTVQQIYIRIKK